MPIQGIYYCWYATPHDRRKVSGVETAHFQTRLCPGSPCVWRTASRISRAEHQYTEDDCLTSDHLVLMIRISPCRPDDFEEANKHFTGVNVVAHLRSDLVAPQRTNDPASVAYFSRQGFEDIPKPCVHWYWDNGKDDCTKCTTYAGDMLSNDSCIRWASDIGRFTDCMGGVSNSNDEF